MAYKIIASQCTVCGACEFECPNAAIKMKGDMYIIDPAKCTECEGAFDKLVDCALVPRSLRPDSQVAHFSRCPVRSRFVSR